LQQGLEWIKKLSETAERDARELKLASTLAKVLLVTRGYTAPETRAAAERARDLAEKGGNLGQLVAQESVIWRNVLTKGDYSSASLLADRLLDLAQREGSRRASDSSAVLRQTRTSIAATSRSSKSSSRAGAASLTRTVSGKFPACCDGNRYRKPLRGGLGSRRFSTGANYLGTGLRAG
jgi:hypothetical protein